MHLSILHRSFTRGRPKHCELRLDPLKYLKSAGAISSRRPLAPASFANLAIGDVAVLGFIRVRSSPIDPRKKPSASQPLAVPGWTVGNMAQIVFAIDRPAQSRAVPKHQHRRGHHGVETGAGAGPARTLTRSDVDKTAERADLESEPEVWF
jgi:hypothetical protein